MADKSASDELLENIQAVRVIGYHGHADRLEKAYMRLSRESFTREQVLLKLQETGAPASAFAAFGLPIPEVRAVPDFPPARPAILAMFDDPSGLQQSTAAPTLEDAVAGLKGVSIKSSEG